MAGFAVQIVNGLSYSLLLFLVAAGLSIVFGMMNLANLAHGSFYMIGGYVALSVITRVGSFWLALAVAPLIVAAIGILVETVFLRRLYHRAHLDQVLLTLGFAYIAWDVGNWMFGADAYILRPPTILTGSVQIFGQSFPIYRLAILVGGSALAAVLIWGERQTRYGTILRAGVTDPEMLRAMGINVKRIFTTAFCIGAGLAGLAGAIGAPVIGLYRGVDFDVLMLAIVVVVVGGLGSLVGTLASSVLIGLTDSLGRVYLPELSIVMIFAVMALVLLLRPAGLFGVERGIGESG